MSPDQIRHYLVTYDVATGNAVVEQFGTDYDRAQRSYAAAERQGRERDGVDIVLLSADSLATIKRTHASYFAGREQLKRELLSV